MMNNQSDDYSDMNDEELQKKIIKEENGLFYDILRVGLEKASTVDVDFDDEETEREIKSISQDITDIATQLW